MRIWCNAPLTPQTRALLEKGLAGHQLVVAAPIRTALEEGRPDPVLADAEVAFGQPPLAQVMASAALRWMEVSSAGYGRYDTPEVREAFQARGVSFTNASSVFADSCAQHVLAMMLALGRRLPESWADQAGERGWHYESRRYQSRLLTGQSVLLLGFGAIGRRLVELLTPFGMKLFAVRRKVQSERGLHVIAEERLSSVLGDVDHVVNLLPENEATRNFVNARRLACMRAGVRFYNVGRGSTVDQEALLRELQGGRVESAYLDVTVPEPLPPEHPLWAHPRCFITPHTAGGRHDQDEAVVLHFLRNFESFVRSGRPDTDLIY